MCCKTDLYNPNLIKTGIETMDVFGNKYIPTLRNGKVTGYKIYDGIRNKYITYNSIEQILNYGYQANTSVDFDPNNY